MRLVMRPTTLIATNFEFFVKIVNKEITCERFQRQLLSSLYKKSVHQFNEIDQIEIDATSVKGTSHHTDFSDEIKFYKLLNRVSKKIEGSMTPTEWNQKVKVIEGGYRFIFEITQYRRGIIHNNVSIKNPMIIPEGEKLGRDVILTITPY